MAHECREWVIDASFDTGEGPLCFVPIEGSGTPEESIVWGITFLGSIPDGAKVIGVVHSEGQCAVEEWVARNEERTKPWIKEAKPIISQPTIGEDVARRLEQLSAAVQRPVPDMILSDPGPESRKEPTHGAA